VDEAEEAHDKVESGGMGGLDNLRKAEAKAEAEEEKKDSEAIARGWPAFGRNYE
jgi:hypothetical protein